MRYITSVERFGIQKGIQVGMEKGMQTGMKQGSLQQAREAVIQVLQVRFSQLPPFLTGKIQQIEQQEVLSELLKMAVIESLEVFEQRLNQLLLS